MENWMCPKGLTHGFWQKTENVSTAYFFIGLNSL